MSVRSRQNKGQGDADERENDSLDLQELIKRKERLDAQLLEYKATLLAENESDKSLEEDDDVENLAVRLNNLEIELADLVGQRDIKTMMLKRLHLGKLLNAKLFGDDNEDKANNNNKKEINELVDKQTQYVKEILSVHKEKRDKERQLDLIREENLCLKQECRELMATAHDLREADASKVSQALTNSKVKKSHDRLELITAKVVLLKHIFQGLILSSGVDWAKDEALQKLVIELGQTLD